jgi:hypothetical protein
MTHRAARIVTAASCLVVLNGCFAHSNMRGSAALSSREMRYAVAIANAEIHKQGSKIRLAVADVHRGMVRSSNTGHSCESGSLLRVTLIGEFPHTAVSPIPGGSTTVHAEVIEADPATGQECLIGVETGRVRAPRGATRLPGIGS